MEAHLPPVFETLAALNAPIAHYKVCSTFDSAPQVGSIGRAIDLAAPVLGGAWHPLVVADPAIGRYQVFGNLFAVAGGVGYRLDRHPTMSCHPVTPMDEADVRRHLAKQTEKDIGLVDYLALKRGEADARLKEELAQGAEIVAIDVARRRDACRGRSTGLGKPRGASLRRWFARSGDMLWLLIGGPQACSTSRDTRSGLLRPSGLSASPVRARR